MIRFNEWCWVVVAVAVISGSTASADITATDAKKVMAQHRGEVSNCYERHAKSQDGATGKVTLDIGVTESGTVDDVSINAPGVDGAKFPRCVTRKVKQWVFPQAGKGGTVVSIPYQFYFADPGQS